MPDVLIESAGDKEPHGESHESAEGLEVHVAGNDDAQEIQGKGQGGIDPLCDGGSVAETLASKVTTSDPNGLDPQLRTPSASGEEGEDSSTSTGEPTSMVKFDVLRFQNGFLEVVEELRMRRVIDSENEERIKQLVTEKHQLQQKLEEQSAHSVSLVRQHSQREQDQKRQHEERHKQLQEEKAKYELSSEGWDRELRALKDEIRALHLAKYNLEKKVQEQERKLQLQTASREGHLSQMAQLEQRCSAAFKQAAEITEYMERLERNAKGAMELNRKLQYDNEHQHCLMEGYRTELQACRQQLVEARVRLEREAAGLVGGAGDDLGLGRAKTVEHDLKMQVELGRQLQSQLAGLREEHQTTLLCLKEAHTLIERHVESSTQLSASEVVLQEEVDTLRERVGSLEQKLGEEGQKCRETEEKYSRERQEWEEKSSDVEHRLKALQADYGALQESYDRLQETERSTSQNFNKQAKCAREKEEKLLARVKEAEEEVEQVRERERKREEEWGERVRELQQALEQSETLLQEREQSLEEKAKQFIGLEAKYNGYLQQPKTILLKDVTAEDRVITHTEPSHPTSPSDQPSGKSSQKDEGSPHVPSPPKSPALSPDIISSSQQLDETLSPSITEEEEVQVKKHLTPRIHLEKISLPLNPSCGPKDADTLTVKENTEQHQTDDSGVDIDAGTTDVQNQDPSALDSTEERGGGMESELQEHYSIMETQTQKHDSSTLPVQVDSRCQPKLSPPLFECVPSPNRSGAPSATKRCAGEIIMDTTNTESPTKKPKIDLDSITDSNMKNETESSEITVDTVVTVIDPLSTSDSKKLSELCSQSQPNSTACALQDETAEACTSSQPVPYLIEIPWKLEIPKRRAMTSKGSTGLECKERSHLSTQQQPKLLLFPDHPMPSDFNSKTLLESDNCGLPQQQETDKSTLQIPTESQGSSSNIKISEPKATATAVTPSEGYPTTSTDGKDTAAGSTNTLSQRDKIATAAENCPTKVENAAGYTAPATEDEAGSLAILFSEDEEEGHDGLLNTQMNRQIDKVQLFLKMDRLRRPKPPRAV